MPRTTHPPDLSDPSDAAAELSRQLDRDFARENGYRTGPADIFAPLPVTIASFRAQGQRPFVTSHSEALAAAQADYERQLAESAEELAAERAQVVQS